MQLKVSSIIFDVLHIYTLYYDFMLLGSLVKSDSCRIYVVMMYRLTTQPSHMMNSTNTNIHHNEIHCVTYFQSTTKKRIIRLTQGGLDCLMPTLGGDIS